MILYIYLLFSRGIPLEGNNISLIIILLVLYQIHVCYEWYIESIRVKYLYRYRCSMDQHRIQMLRNTAIYDIFKSGKGNRTEEEWKELFNTVDVIYDGFVNKLYKIHDFTDFELQVCLLIKINISPSDMAIITNHSRESISATRRRLYEKVFKRKGKPKSWDKFIMSL